MNRLKYKLNSEQSQGSSNVDGFMKIGLSSKDRLLPSGEINKIINVGEQFELERQSSTYYRLLGTISTLFSNPLFNLSGQDSWVEFDEEVFKDKSYPQNGLGDPEDITYTQSIKEHLKEVDGWFGYFDPDVSKQSLCAFTDMEPQRRRFSMIQDKDNDNKKNWEFTITYPASSAHTELTQGTTSGVNGILIVEAISSI